MSWPSVELGDICKPKQHKTVPSSELLEAGFVVYGANGPIGYYSEFTHDRTTIAITCRGATCGTINVVPPKSYITGNAMALDDLDETRVELKFLRYALEHQGFKGVINGAAQPQITRGPLLTYKIPLPPLEEQRRIAGVLDQADALRRLRTRALDKLNTLSQATFHEMFGDPANNSRNWPKSKIRDAVARISDGPFGSNLKSSHYTESGIRVWRLQNIGVGEVKDEDRAFISEEHFKGLRKHECLPGDVIVGTLGEPNLRACVQPSSMEVALNKADCVQIRPDTGKALAEYWIGLLNHPSTLGIAHSAVLGQTRARISMGRLRELIVPLPPVDLQLRYQCKIKELERLKEGINASRVADGKLFSSLQHRAFRGTL